jgi:hypothetical protein
LRTLKVEDPFTCTFKRDTTIISGTHVRDHVRDTEIPAASATVLEHLNKTLSSVTYGDRPVVVLSGCFYNGAAIINGGTEHKDRIRILSRLRTFRPDTASVIPDGMTSTATLIEATAALKRNFSCFDLECFLHRCTSATTSTEYRDGTIGPVVRKFVTYDRGARYTFKLGAIADASTDRAEALLYAERARRMKARAAASAKKADAKKADAKKADAK